MESPLLRKKPEPSSSSSPTFHTHNPPGPPAFRSASPHTLATRSQTPDGAEIPLSNGVGGHWISEASPLLDSARSLPPSFQLDGSLRYSLDPPDSQSPAHRAFSPPPDFRSVPRFPGPPGPPVFASPPPRPSAAPGVPALSPSLPTSPPFTEIPFSGAETRSPFDTNGAKTVDGGPFRPAYHQFDSSSWSAASSFVLFSAHTVMKEKKSFNIASLGFGALVCPGRVMIPGPPTVRRNPFRCQSCGAFSNLYCGIVPSTGQWKCSFCDKMNGSSGEYRPASREDLQNWPELVTSVVDYVEVSTRRPGFVPVSDTTMAAPLVILLDEGLDEPHLQHLQSSLHGFLDSLPSATRVGLISYGKTVSVYDFSQSGVAAADVFPGDTLPNQELLKSLLYGTGVYLAPLNVCLSVAHDVVSSLRPYREGLPEAARHRCVGTAVEIALSLIQGPSTEMPRSLVKRSAGSSRIIVCMAGPNNLGRGSVPHSQSHPNYMYLEKKAIKQMELLGQEARRQDAVVDILCGGTCPVRVPVLQPLASASGGVLILHDDFGEAFGLNLQRAVKRASGFRVVLEARFSDCFNAIHVVGPGKEASSDAHESRKNDRSIVLEASSLEECQSFALIMELNRDIEEENVYFQFAAQYTNLHQTNVTRVITVRLPTSSSLSSYVQSVDDEVAAVLVGKRMAAFGKGTSDAVAMRTMVDERLKDIALKLGKPMSNSKLRCFPSELPRFAEILFHLKRGPLLGSIIGHDDERMVLRNIFLQASFDLSLRMLSPRVLMHREGGTFEELPAYNLAMQSDAALVLDHGTDVFIWMGSELVANETLSAAALAACRTLVEELTEQRFPAPRVLSFKEGTSQARYLQSRLTPAHKDPPYEQEARFPQLRTLKPEQRAKLKSKFYHVDDLSFCEYMRSLRLVPAEPH